MNVPSGIPLLAPPSVQEDLLNLLHIAHLLSAADSLLLCYHSGEHDWFRLTRNPPQPESCWISECCTQTHSRQTSSTFHHAAGSFTGVPVPASPFQGVICLITHHAFTPDQRQLDGLMALAERAARILAAPPQAPAQETIPDAIGESRHEILGHINDGYLRLDANFCYLYVNDRIGKMIRRDPASLIGKNVWEEFPEAVGSATWKAFHQALREQRYLCHEDYNPALDLWQENHIYPVSGGLSVFIRDISDQKRAELALQRTEERFALALEGSSDVIWDWDIVRDEVYYSPKMLLWLGLPENARPPSRADIRRLLHPADRKSTHRAIFDHLEHKTLLHHTCRMRHTSGSYAWYLIRGQAVWDATGTPVRVAGSVSDITEQTLAREKLIASENKLLAYFNSTEDIVVLIGKDRKVLAHNDPAARYFQQAFDQKLSDKMDIREGIPEIARQAFEADLDLALVGERVEKEVCIPFQQTYLWWKAVMAPIRDAQGRIFGVAFTNTNITARKTAEDARQKSEEMFRSLVQNAPGAVYRFNIRSDGSNYFSYLSKRYQELFNIPAGKFEFPQADNQPKLTMEWMLNNLEDDKEAIRASIMHAAKVFSPWEHIGRIRGQDGIIRWYHAKSTPSREGDEVVFNGMMIDITDLKQMEEDKQALILELTRKNIDLRQFSYITTHNLRAPLTNLMAIAALVDTRQIPDPRTRQLIQAFKTSTTQLNGVLTDLCNILAIRDQVRLAVAFTPFAESWGKVMQAIHDQVTESGATLCTDFSEAPGVVFDPAYLENILLNLATNALRYASPKRTLQVHVRSFTAGGRVHLTFSDNGLGMDMQRIEGKIFGLHQRFHHHPDSRGLGLYLVYTQLTALGGTIAVDSREDTGTTFTLTFQQPDP